MSVSAVCRDSIHHVSGTSTCKLMHGHAGHVNVQYKFIGKEHKNNILAYYLLIPVLRRSYSMRGCAVACPGRCQAILTPTLPAGSVAVVRSDSRALFQCLEAGTQY